MAMSMDKPAASQYTGSSGPRSRPKGSIDGFPVDASEVAAGAIPGSRDRRFYQPLSSPAQASTSENFLPGLTKQHDDSRYNASRTSLPATPSQPSSKSRLRPVAWRSRSSEAYQPGRPTTAQTRLRTRTLEDDLLTRASTNNWLQGRSRVGSLRGQTILMPDENEDGNGNVLVASQRMDQDTKGSGLSRFLRVKTSALEDYQDEPSSSPLEPTTTPSGPPWDTKRLLEMMANSRGRMQGYVQFRWSHGGDWSWSYSCINENYASLLCEKPDRTATDPIVAVDLRGAQLRVSMDAYLQKAVLKIRPKDAGATLNLFPLFEADFERWFAALLCWQVSGNPPTNTSRGGLIPITQAASRQRTRSHLNPQNTKEGSIIKVGKMLTYDLEGTHGILPPSELVKTGTSDFGSLVTSRWKKASCTLGDTGDLKLQIADKVPRRSTIRLSQLPRSAVQRLDPSVLDVDHCIAIYPQYSATTHAALQLWPIFLAFESEVLQEVWYVLCRAFTVPELYGPKQPAPPDSLQSDELLPGLSSSSPSTVLFRIERSVSIQVNEVKFKRPAPPAAGTPTEADPVINGATSDPMGTYFAQILIDGQIRGKTTLKHETNNPAWYEKFVFFDLPKRMTGARVIINRYEPVDIVPRIPAPDEDKLDARLASNPNEAVRGHNVHCGELYLDLDEPVSQQKHEGWWPIFGASDGKVGDVQLKFQADETIVLVDREYKLLSEILHHFANGLTMQIADKIPIALVKLADYLLNIFQVSGQATDWLISLAEEEIDGVQGVFIPPRPRFNRRLESNDSHDSVFSTGDREMSVRDMTKAATGEASLLFRGNTLFTKAMDSHMKRLGKLYLDETIGDELRFICKQDPYCEVDPNKIVPSHDIANSWRRLIPLVEDIWSRIFQSVSRFPTELRTVFRLVRACAEDRYGEYLRSAKYTSVSGLLFLRFFCPAIFSPKLFGLLKETPKPKAARTFILIAKALQGLANMATLGHKEPWMEPMNQFLSAHRHEFKSFVDGICSVPSTRSPPTVSPSYSTPLAIFTRIPPASREGFPSLPYLIDHSRNFAALIDLWLNAYNANISKSVANIQPLEGDLLRFHTLCLDLRQRTKACFDKSLRAERRSSSSERWRALVERLEKDPTIYWDPIPINSGPADAQSPREDASPHAAEDVGYTLEEALSQKTSPKFDADPTWGTHAPDLGRSTDKDRSKFAIFGRKKKAT